MLLSVSLLCVWNAFVGAMKKRTMESLTEKFKSLLQSDCLSQEEKKYLKHMFREFVQKREIIQRPTMEVEPEFDCSEDWVRNNFG